MADSLFSLNNDLAAPNASSAHLELNPSVLTTGGTRKYALSAVYVGPAVDGEDAALSMRVTCDGAQTSLDAIHQQTEATDQDEWLTVALFSVSRSFLELLADANDVEVRFGSGRAELTRRLAPDNRDNVCRFLSLVGLDTGIASTSSAIAAGLVA